MRAQAMAQLIEPIVPLGRENRPGFPPIKSNERQRDSDSMFNQNRLALGLGRGAKIFQPTIAPCPDALLSATIKSKAVDRVVAPSKHIFKEPHVPSESAPTNAILTGNYPAQEKIPIRKRVSHAFKRGMESDPVVATVSSSSKRGRILHEGLPTISSRTTPSAATETQFEENSADARTRQKTKSIIAIKPQEIVKLGVKTRMPSENEELQQKIIQPKHFRHSKETVIKGPTSETDTDAENGLPMEVHASGPSQTFFPEREMTITIPSVAENSGVMIVEGRSLSPVAEKSPRSSDAEGSHVPPEVEERHRPPDPEESPRSPDVEESHRSPDVEESPHSPDVEESPHSPDVEESPNSPDVEESPNSPDVEESPNSPDVEVNQKTSVVEDGSKSLEDQPLQSFDKDGRLIGIDCGNSSG
ncbi:histone-lysine N-methyltransferase 2D-like [Daphnia carinata]|uniref:histone-lysine N-methyltransferase 2D-like n=1 Tax=Daphnia carinata TaxID=120202 RepID=UPI00257E005A|nr:histone-lysine N-methyltransferase 2D-like [Daphnia carinata]XP_057366505.1 histone-lysine N-methyltransferase 2D-like [Daphnia carinata]XP_057366506.1 histone-lysine N-methyltransferase 2D-like [Daphnia carinata]